MSGAAPAPARLDIRRVAFHDADFARCMQIRLAVFVQEQNVPLQEERDGWEATALHFLACENGAALATARVVRLATGAVKITRVAVVKAARGKGIGAALMRHVEQAVPGPEYLLDAQVQALPFYERLGYAVHGEPFREVGIAHRHMRKDGAV